MIPPITPTSLTIEVSPDEQLSINVTGEGIILDAFLGDEVVGTMGMMFDEWYDYVKGRA